MSRNARREQDHHHRAYAPACSAEAFPAGENHYRPSQEAIKRHLAAIEQRLQQLQTAPQAQVIAELNPLIRGWAAYYNGVVEPQP